MDNLNSSDVTLLGIDPGGTTGVAYLNNGHFEFDQLRGRWAVYELVATTDADIIVCENFIWQPHLIGGKRGEPGFERIINLDAPKVIGAVEVACIINDVQLVFQNPGERVFWTNDKLKRAGLWKTNSPHAMDALRHLLRYITDKLGDKTYLHRLR